MRQTTYWNAPCQLFYWGWSIMAVYVNLHAGVGKPLWEITLGEYSVWFQVRRQFLFVPGMAAVCSS